MIGEMLCPECGGVVGATEITEAGAPCKCFTAETARRSIDVEEPAPVVAEAPVEKICLVCGKDVTGKKRVKDARGYMCYECAKEDEKKLNYGRVRCQVCGHLSKEEAQISLDGVRMCPTCYKEKQDLKKMQIGRMGVRGARTREELRRVYLLVGAVVVLAIIMAMGAYRLIHQH